MAPPAPKPGPGYNGDIPMGLGLGTAFAAVNTTVVGFLFRGAQVETESSGEFVEDAANGCAAALGTLFVAVISIVISLVGIGLSGLAVILCVLAIARGYRRRRFVYLNAAAICVSLTLIGLGIYLIDQLGTL